MVEQKYEETVEIPEGIQVEIDKGTVTVKGDKGEVRKNLFNPLIKISKQDNHIKFESRRFTKQTKKIINTFKAHVSNAIRGAKEGHTYKLKICSGHFPMTVSVKGDVFEVKNFIGEKVPRTIKIKEGTTVKVDGTEITVEGPDKEHTGQMAAMIEKLLKRPGFDTRIFQDGIYITEKDGKKI